MCQLCVTGRFQEQVGTAWKDRQFARQFFSKVLSTLIYTLEYTSALTYENLCMTGEGHQGCRGQMSVAGAKGRFMGCLKLWKKSEGKRKSVQLTRNETA